MTTFLVFAAAGSLALGILTILRGYSYLTALFHDPSEAITLASSVFLLGVICGFATYFLLKRRHDAQLKELSSLLIDMKQKIVDGEKSSEGITGDALSLANKLVTLLPDMVRTRSQDSILFGAAAFIAVTLVSGNLGVAILVGVIVWLYFRYENAKTYEQEISKFEEQKRVFEQREKEFLETL